MYEMYEITMTKPKILASGANELCYVMRSHTFPAMYAYIENKYMQGNNPRKTVEHFFERLTINILTIMLYVLIVELVKTVQCRYPPERQTT